MTCALALCACDGGGGNLAERPQRIVVITLDTLRFDTLDPTHDAGQMPETRAFAERGAWFDSFWAASSATQPTHATLFTGQHPWEHGVPRNGAVLPGSHRTVAERLSAGGFATAAVVASFPLDPRFGFAQGFDVYVHEFDSRYYGADWEGQPVGDRRFYQLAEPVTDRALALLDEARYGDQLLWLHYFDAHEPYGDEGDPQVATIALHRARDRGEEAFARALRLARAGYDEDVARLDASLGRLFERLDDDADRFETHVLLTADHGESFGEHGALGHGSRVTPEQVQAPLVIVSPRVTPGVRRDVAGSIDVATTLLALAGLPDPTLPGRDLTVALEPDAGQAFGMSGVPADPLRPGEARSQRFFVVREGRHYVGTDELVIEYDESENLPTDEATARPLRALFGRLEARLAGVPTTEQTDPETRAALRALGYVE